MNKLYSVIIGASALVLSVVLSPTHTLDGEGVFQFTDEIGRHCVTVNTQFGVALDCEWEECRCGSGCEVEPTDEPNPTPPPVPTPTDEPDPTPEPKPKCNSGRGNNSEGDPDCDPGNSGGHNQGGD